MIDTDVRLGLSGSDLAIRSRQFEKDLARLDEFTLSPDTCPEYRVMVEAGLGGEIVGAKRFREQDFLTVRKNRIGEILTLLRDHADTDYKLVSDIFGVDLLGFEKEPRYEVVYSLYSISTRRRIVIKAQVDEDDPTIDSVSEVWPARKSIPSGPTVDTGTSDTMTAMFRLSWSVAIKSELRSLDCQICRLFVLCFSVYSIKESHSVRNSRCWYGTPKKPEL